MCCHLDSFYTCPTLPALECVVTLTSGRSLRSLQCWALVFDLAGEAEMLLQADSLILQQAQEAQQQGTDSNYR